MNKKILLINPKSFNYTLNYPYTGLFYIATVLKKNNFNVQVIDCDFKETNPFKKIEKFNPEITGISCFSSSLKNCLDIAKYAKEKNSCVILGGPHINAIKKAIIEFDIISWNL